MSSDMVVHAFISSMGLQRQGALCSEFQDSQNYTETLSANRTNKTKQTNKGKKDTFGMKG